MLKDLDNDLCNNIKDVGILLELVFKTSSKVPLSNY